MHIATYCIGLCSYDRVYRDGEMLPMVRGDWQIKEKGEGIELGHGTIVPRVKTFCE